MKFVQSAIERTLGLGLVFPPLGVERALHVFEGVGAVDPVHRPGDLLDEHRLQKALGRKLAEELRAAGLGGGGRVVVRSHDRANSPGVLSTLAARPTADAA